MDLQTSTDISSWSRSSTKESADAEDALEQNSAFLDWYISKLGKSCCIGCLQYSCNLKIQEHIVLRSAKKLDYKVGAMHCKIQVLLICLWLGKS